MTADYVQLRAPKCEKCDRPYIWAVTDRPAEGGQEWRAVPDCTCTPAVGLRGDAFPIRSSAIEGR